MFTYLSHRLVNMSNILIKYVSLRSPSMDRNKHLVVGIFISLRRLKCLDSLEVKMSVVCVSVVTFLLLYVDDIFLIGNDIPTFQEVKSWLGRCFAMKDLGVETYIIKKKNYRDRKKHLIGLSQSIYLDNILKHFSMENSKKCDLPIHHIVKLSKSPCPDSNEEIDAMSRVLYVSGI